MTLTFVPKYTPKVVANYYDWTANDTVSYYTGYLSGNFLSGTTIAVCKKVHALQQDRLKNKLRAKLHIVSPWSHIATCIWVNIGSRNGLFPDGTKLLPETTLLAINKAAWHSFHRNVSLNTSVNSQAVFEIYTFEIRATSPREDWVTNYPYHITL